jgi:hypothetical protein
MFELPAVPNLGTNLISGAAALAGAIDLNCSLFLYAFGQIFTVDTINDAF